MALINIQRRHELDEERIREQIEALAQEFAQQVGIRYQWQGGQLNLERSGASGYIRMNPGMLEIHLKLGMLLSPMKGKIEQTIVEYLDRHLV